VASIESREVLGETGAKTAQGKGVCVGLPDPKAKVRIIKISDHAIESWSDDLLVGEGEIGEIVVNSPAVTTEYFGRPEQTALAKIRDVDGSVIHRMGDLGALDEAGRLWFCGRKSHRLETAQGPMYTLCCEGVFNDHPQVFRTALVGTGERGAQEPVLLVERELEVSGPRLSAAELTAELLELGSRWSHTQAIQKVIYHPGFPVDIRHNAKINREQLSRWAEQRR
jgi:acyl-CoA synthetase (AMP-forming)/AMP-acid ligase II